MRSNVALRGILFLLIGISPTSVISDGGTPIQVVMLYDKANYYDTLGPAFSVAFRRLQEASLNYTFEKHVLDTMGSVTMITRAYFQAEKNWKPHLYVGEKDSPLCRTIGTLAASKNRLYISLGGSIEQFAMDRDSFPTFASSGRGTTSMAQLVVKAMKKFQWTKAAIIVALAQIYTLQARFVKKAILAEGMTYIPYIHAESNLTGVDFLPRRQSVKIMFENLKKRANCESAIEIIRHR